MTAKREQHERSALDEIMRRVSDERAAQGLPPDRFEDEQTLASIAELIAENEQQS